MSHDDGHGGNDGDDTAVDVTGELNFMEEQRKQVSSFIDKRLIIFHGATS